MIILAKTVFITSIGGSSISYFPLDYQNVIFMETQFALLQNEFDVLPIFLRKL